MELRATRSPILVETLPSRPVPRVRLVHCERVHLRVLRTLVPVGESVLFNVAWVRMGALLSQVELTVHVEVVHLLKWHPSALLRLLLSISIGWLAVGCSVIIRTSLAVCAFFLDDELLARVGIDLVDLRQLLLLLRLKLLGLLLFVLFQTLFTLITGQLAVIGAFGHALRLSTACSCITAIS